MNVWDKPLEEISDELLAVLARQVFRRRNAGMDGLALSETTWQVSRKRVLELLDEAERRGIITRA